MKRYIVFLLIIINFIIVGCKKSDNASSDSVSKGSIYGVVTDYLTGQPVQNANVQLRPSGETTLTGSDGKYQFLNVEDGNYSITVSKAEYTDLVDDYVIEVRNGGHLKRDVRIQKHISLLHITDVFGNDITTLDFGSNPSDNIKSFYIFNDGTVTINYNLYYSCNWISNVSSVTNNLQPGQNTTITVTIDRSKLNAGNNSTIISIVSNNGSNALQVNAIGEYVEPEVITLPPTSTSGASDICRDVFNGRITVVGNPAYTQKGFCYSTTNTEPTISDNRINVDGTGIGDYSYYNSGFFWTYVYSTTIHYRAWVMYGDNNSIKYGNVITYVYYDVK